MQISNYYDRLDVDINQLFETKLDIDGEKYPSLLKRLFNRYSFALLIKSGLINPLVEVGFIIKNLKHTGLIFLKAGLCICMTFIIYWVYIVNDFKMLKHLNGQRRKLFLSLGKSRIQCISFLGP